MSVNGDALCSTQTRGYFVGAARAFDGVKFANGGTRTVAMKFIRVLCLGVFPALAACGVVMAADSPEVARAKMLLRTKQFTVAFQELEAAAARGDVQSEYLLGEVYANGLGTPVSESDARRWLTAAARASYPDAAKALSGLTTVAPTRSAAGDKELARELVVWAIRHKEFSSLETFVKVSGVDAVDEFGRAPLAYAVMAGSPEAVHQLIKAGAVVDRPDHFGTTALMLAAEGASGPVFTAVLAGTKKLDARDSVGNTALCYAARVGRRTHVERLLALGASIKGANADGWSVLDVSAKAGHPDIARLLHEAGATGSLKVALVRDVTGVDPTQAGALYEGWPAVAIAASRDDDRMIESLLTAGARADELTPQGDTALMVAAKYHAAKVIAPLLKAGVAPDIADDDGTTPLGYAAAHGVTDVLDAMLEKGVSPDIHGPTEDPPLVRAARAGDLTAVNHLLEAGADVNATFLGGMTALMITVAAPSPDIFDRVMAGHPNVALRDRSGRSALWFAAGTGDERMVDALLAAGSPIDGAGKQQSPLFAAVQTGRANILERLLRKGVPVDTRNAAGETPLIAAAALGDTSVVRALLEGGAGVDAQNAAGNTALIVATREGHLEVCQVLLKAGANAGLHNQDRINALDTARRRHLTEITALLESH